MSTESNSEVAGAEEGIFARNFHISDTHGNSSFVDAKQVAHAHLHLPQENGDNPCGRCEQLSLMTRSLMKVKRSQDFEGARDQIDAREIRKFLDEEVSSGDAEAIFKRLKNLQSLIPLLTAALVAGWFPRTPLSSGEKLRGEARQEFAVLVTKLWELKKETPELFKKVQLELVKLGTNGRRNKERVWIEATRISHAERSILKIMDPGSERWVSNLPYYIISHDLAALLLSQNHLKESAFLLEDSDNEEIVETATRLLGDEIEASNSLYGITTSWDLVEGALKTARALEGTA